MKRLSVFIALTLIVSMLLMACGTDAPEPTVEVPPTDAPPEPTEAAPAPTEAEPEPEPEPTEVPPTEPPAADEPVSGGVLRIIAAAGPQVLSYVPLMGPTDRSFIFPGTEALIDTQNRAERMAA